MNFFDSEIVKSELKEVSLLQEKIYNNVFEFPSMTDDEKLKHISTLQELLEKQKVLYTRLSLSEDPEAVTMKKRIEDSAILMGMPEGMDMNLVFNDMSRVIKNMKENLDWA
jgi:Cu/Ag efflux protein CusF